MTEPAAAAAEGTAVEGAAAEEPAPQNTWKQMAWRFLTMYIMMSVIPALFKGKGATAPAEGGNIPIAAGHASNMWGPNTPIELYVFTSTDLEFNQANASLIWYVDNLLMGEWYDGEEHDGKRSFEASVPATPELQNNGSLYLHIIAAKLGAQINPLHSEYKKRDVVTVSKMWTRYKLKKAKTTANLLTGKTEVTDEQRKDMGEIISYWHPNITISILDDQKVWPISTIVPPFDKFINVDMEVMQYWPVLYINDYWELHSDSFPVNDTLSTLPLSITYSPISMFYFQMYEAQKMQKQWNSMLGVSTPSEEENDIVKRTMLETNPYLLAVTIVVSLVHTVFEFLAFKNDIQFWKSRKSLEGLSVRSILFNVFTQLIVVLYVLDNDTNMMVAISVCIGLLIEFWKIKRLWMSRWTLLTQS